MEPRHWLSDGTGESENSSLSGSFSGDETSWPQEHSQRTPTVSAGQGDISRLAGRRRRRQSSGETLTQERLAHANMEGQPEMAGVEGKDVHEGAREEPHQEIDEQMTPRVNLPETPKRQRRTTMDSPNSGTGQDVFSTPKTPGKRALKTKVPWKGKNIIVAMPQDEGRGQPGKAPMPLDEVATARMLRSWNELGYDTTGFNLNTPSPFAMPDEYSQSRGAWPDFKDVARDRAQQKYTVLLPDLNAWKKYVDELNEAKLRALGVSFGDDVQPSTSPVSSTVSRQPSVTHYPVPFSPPLPTSSAASNAGPQGFAFPSRFSPVGPSPGLPGAATPGSFAGRHKPRASMSAPPSAWSPHMFQHRAGSPSLTNLNGIMSPVAPFSPDMASGFPTHQRHQSLQYPVMPHQSQQSARVTPRLQEVLEDEEEAAEKSTAETLDPAVVVSHKANSSLQKEIDEAEYHLEEQMRSQLDNDRDYSPHNEDDKAEATANSTLAPSQVQQTGGLFAPQAPLFTAQNDGAVLHHPRPHSRGHSLSQKYFTEEDAHGQRVLKPLPPKGFDAGVPEEFEADSSAGRDLHQRSFSTASNPWTDNEASKGVAGSSARGSKPPLSKFNVDAPEFKFSPSGPFNAGNFTFTSSSFVPPPAAAFPLPRLVDSSQFGLPCSNSAPKINATAPIFSPGSSDFSFSAAALNFRPDAPTFTPLHSMSNSIASPYASGAESGSNRASSIFGKIDLMSSDILKPPKRSKAIPIIRPTSHHSPGEDTDASELQLDTDGRVTDDSRVKRARNSIRDGDEVPRFMEGHEEATPVPDIVPQASNADTAVSSTMVSDTSATKATPSPGTSPDRGINNREPSAFTSNFDMRSFNDARPFGESSSRPSHFKRGHKKTLSAAAHDFVPGAGSWTLSGAEADDLTDADLDETGHEAGHTPDIPIAKSMEAFMGDSIFQSVEVPPPEAEVEKVEDREAVGSSPRQPAAHSGGLSASRFATAESPVPAKRTGLPASPSPIPYGEVVEAHTSVSPIEAEESSTPPIQDFTSVTANEPLNDSSRTDEPSVDDIDAIMRHLNENPSKGVNKMSSQGHQPGPQSSPLRDITLAGVNASPLRLLPQMQTQFRTDALSPSPQQYGRPNREEVQPHMSTELEDPFVDPPQSAVSLEKSVHHLQPSQSPVVSDWDGEFSDDEQRKLEDRVNFFDGRVNRLVDGLLAERLESLESTLDGIKRVLAVTSRGTPSSRRDRRSISAEILESDADDEDDDIPVARRSMSPRRDRKMDQIKAAILDAFAVQQRTLARDTPQPASRPLDNAAIFSALDALKEQFEKSLHLDFRAEDLRNVVEDAVERRMQSTTLLANADESGSTDPLQARVMELEKMLRLQECKVESEHAARQASETRVVELEEKIRAAEDKVESEIAARRAAEDVAADLDRKLQTAETKIEVEMMNKSIFDQRAADLEERLQQQEAKSQEELAGRRNAEDQLSEVQRLLRTSSEEEGRLSGLLQEREQKIKSIEASASKASMRLALLEAGQSNSLQDKSESQNRANVLETDLHDARKEAHRWRSEAERLAEALRHSEDDINQTGSENKAMRKIIDTLGIQLREMERIRDVWRVKSVSLQEDMAQAARDISEENNRRAKKEAALMAHQEVLDAKLQAEARTRERMEQELERLESGERQGMRAVSECKRLEGLLAEMRTENHHLQQAVLRHQAEFSDARESGAREVQRTREALQAEVDNSNHQVNVVREELEEHIARLRSQLDQVKLNADTAKAHHEMLLEEAHTSKQAELGRLEQKHLNEMEDMQARHERQLNEVTEDAQRSEQNLLERLSISTSKSEHLQDKVVHLEEKLEMARAAARAAAQAAQSSVAGRPELPAASVASVPAAPLGSVPKQVELPEKISPQALRESIMVLQEQLQERELKIEQMEAELAKVDPDAKTKISKRDDEITWLRELLAVRHGDLQDIISALGRDKYDTIAVKDAAIRLKANLQMEEQERERAMNGGSAITLPNIAATIRDATPRVAQAVGPIAAAWGNWRKSSTGSGPSSANPTPSKSTSGNLLGGLMTPPASDLRQTPTVFSNTRRRFTAQDLANRPRSKQTGKMLVGQEHSAPVTPPMMRPSAYDADAQAADDFDDADFFDDDD